MIFIITILVVILIIIFTIIINSIIVSPDVVTVVLLIIVLHIINIINCVYTKIVIVVVGQMVSERPPGASAAVWKTASPRHFRGLLEKRGRLNPMLNSAGDSPDA